MPALPGGGRPAGDGVRPAAYADLDPALLTLALGWAVRDLATWQSGELPTTWSSTVTIGADLQPGVTRWPRHPHCGCSLGLERATGRRLIGRHHHALSSLPSIARRWVREHSSQ